MFKNYEDILTFEELCEALRISASYSYKLLRTNKIKSYKDGKSCKVKKVVNQKQSRKKSFIYKHFR